MKSACVIGLSTSSARNDTRVSTTAERELERTFLEVANLLGRFALNQATHRHHGRIARDLQRSSRQVIVEFAIDPLGSTRTHVGDVCTTVAFGGFSQRRQGDIISDLGTRN